MKACALLFATVLLTVSKAMPPPPQCTPGVVEDVPPRMRKVCAALSTIYELSNAMESYLDDNSVLKEFMWPDSIPIMDSDVKRKDVDHMFLRFGRRR